MNASLRIALRRNLPMFCALGVCAAVSATLIGQQRDAPAATPQRGTATIAGSVIDDATAEPIRRAIVSLRGPGLPPTRSVVTDDEGRFALRNLPGGRYSLVATKAAYLASAYGARRPGRPGISTQLQDTVQMTAVILRMARGGVMEGTIRDEAGSALSGVSVYLFDPSAPGNLGSTMFTSGQIAAVTDDRGVYRFFGLQPGEYVIAALLNANGAGEISRGREAEIDTLLGALERSRSAASGTGPIAVSGRTTTVGYAPTFYPGVVAFSRAIPIRVVAGQERVGLDFTLDAVPTATIAGTVSRADGQSPAGVRLSYVAEGPRVFGSTGGPFLTGPDAEGRFRYTSVPPGHYTIYARSESALDAPVGMVGRGSPPPVVPATRWFARADVDVLAGNLSGISLHLRPGASVSGRVIFEAASPDPPPGSTQVQVRLSVQPGGDWSSSSGGTSAGPSLFTPQAVSASPNAAFAITNVGPGPYRLTSSIQATSPGGWWLRSAMLGDRDLLDGTLEVGTDPISGVVLTFTDRRTELAGFLQSAAGIAAPEYSLVLFPADRSRWQPGSLRIKSTRPASDGQFSVTNVPGGDYLLGVLTDFEPGDLERIDFLTELATTAVRVTLRDGERTVQDVRVAR